MAIESPDFCISLASLNIVILCKFYWSNGQRRSLSCCVLFSPDENGALVLVVQPYLILCDFWLFKFPCLNFFQNKLDPIIVLSTWVSTIGGGRFLPLGDIFSSPDCCYRVGGT